jgi:PPIC-type PPIASE domain
MIALNRGRKVAFGLAASAAVAALAAFPVYAQQGGFARGTAAPSQPSGKAAVGDGPRLQEVRVPTNTTDPIAIVNGEVISRQQLADECVARKGQEILDTLIARRLIEQEMRRKKIEITPLEIDQEIDAVAMATAGVTREIWLRNLDKERGISPASYARDIIYPSLALKKLATPRVQVTEQDLKDAYEANFGPRMRARIITVDNIRTANEIWNELNRNPAGFERIAKERSRDNSTRAAGGLLPDLIARHAYPRNISDPAYAQLVDGNPGDKDSKGQPIKPKDGAITGPIQVNENAWLIMKREELLPPTRSGSLSDANVREMLRAQMVDVKLNDMVQQIFKELMDASAIDNKLTGHVKLANEEQHPEFKEGLDQKVQRMSNAGETQANLPTGGRSPSVAKTSPSRGPLTPAGVPKDAAAAAGKVQQTLQSPPRPPTTTPPGN